MIPGFKKIASQVDSEQAQQELARIKAIIDSMTKQERRNHLVLNGSAASGLRRVAAPRCRKSTGSSSNSSRPAR